MVDRNPLGSGSSPDEFCSSDEVKVFKDEGEDETEQNASECLQAELLEEEKSSLIKESEQVRPRVMFCKVTLSQTVPVLNVNPLKFCVQVLM